ncbi:hypothetical protein [Burkholderia glumae]|uniref:hypothetical protein n=1 Tax=Burkholderia glumae TaxID=337 RepID=UPI0020D00203|nr:hypothetical protein [Burkholderia glumae]
MARVRQKSAKAFYERVGFEASPVDPMLLLVTLADLEHALRPNRTYEATGENRVKLLLAGPARHLNT